MKKMFLAIVLWMAPSIGKSAGLGDLIKSTLIDHVSAVSQLGNGHTKQAAIDSIILIGKYNGKSILHLQGGFNRDITEDDTTHAIYGAQLRLDPFVNERLNLPEGWTFLKSLEHGPAIHYDTRLKRWYGYYQVGLAFGLQPIR